MKKCHKCEVEFPNFREFREHYSQTHKKVRMTSQEKEWCAIQGAKAKPHSAGCAPQPIEQQISALSQRIKRGSW